MGTPVWICARHDAPRIPGHVQLSTRLVPISEASTFRKEKSYNVHLSLAGVEIWGGQVSRSIAKFV